MEEEINSEGRKSEFEGASYDDDHINENEEEDDKYVSDTHYGQVNKTESKMIDPSQIQYEINDEE